MQTIQRLITTNWLALLVNVIAHFALGMGWYGVFAAQWMEGIAARERGFDPQAAPPAIYLTSIVSVLLGTLFVAWLMDTAGERGLSAGLKYGLIVWIGIAAPLLLMHYAFAGNPLNLVVIDSGYELLGLTITGAIVGALGLRTRPAGAPVRVPAAA
jgi:preprotein translocase subunit SecY